MNDVVLQHWNANDVRLYEKNIIINKKNNKDNNKQLS